MSKLRATSFGVLALAALLFVLLNNKKQMAAKSVPDIQMTVPVRVVSAIHKQLSEPLTLVGEIAGENDVVVVAETEGRITSVFVDVGKTVTAGEAMFQIDDELKRAAFATAEVNHEKAQRDFARYQTLRSDSTVSETQLESARLALKAAEAAYTVARRQLDDTKVKSPITGVVSDRPVNIGTRVKIGDVMANVVNIKQLKTKLQVAERDVFRLHVGDEVSIQADVYPDATFKGRIKTISDKADAAHTFAVEIALTNPSETPLKAGMFVRAHFDVRDSADALAIPREVLTGSLRDPQVFVVKNGIAGLRRVVIEREVGGWLAIESGLTPGEAVVVSGQNNLRDSMSVTVLQ